jgi:2'-5' RNA ligase
MIKDFFAKRVWNPAGSWLHVLAIPADAELNRVVRRYQQVLEPLREVLVPVAAEDLHMTVAKLRPVAEVHDDVVADLIAGLGTRLREIDPIDVVVGPALVGRSNVRLAVYPEAPVDHLIASVVKTASTVLGYPVKQAAAPPHLTLAYGIRDDQDADLCVVNDIRGGRAPWTIDRIAVVDQTQNASTGTYTWTLRSIVPLGATEAP